MKVAAAAWIIGGLGLLACVIGAVVQPEAFAFAWLAALTIWLRWPLGCLALLLVHALTGGGWGVLHPAAVWCREFGVLPLLLPAHCPAAVPAARICIPGCAQASDAGQRLLPQRAVRRRALDRLPGGLVRPRRTGDGSSAPQRIARGDRCARVDPAGPDGEFRLHRRDHVARPALQLQRLWDDQRRGERVCSLCRSPSCRRSWLIPSARGNATTWGGCCKVC